VRGFVYDATGAAIVGAKVSVTNPSTGLKREVTTDAGWWLRIRGAQSRRVQTSSLKRRAFATYNVKQIVVNVAPPLVWTFT